MAHSLHGRRNTDSSDIIDLDAIEIAPPSPHETTTTTTSNDLNDPTPDVHSLFAYYNRKHFGSKLTNVYVEFSKRMTLCAGTCTFRGVGGCRIALSEPLLKLRPASDLRSTLLHEMIHALLFNEGVSRDGPDGHGPRFMEVAARINASEPPEVHVTPYHSFTSEVDHYRTHHWKCTSCHMIIKRAMNRPPGPYDLFWDKHLSKCSGAFEKIREPHKKPHQASIPKRRVIAVKSKAAKEKSSLSKDVVTTFRIDEMLASRGSRQEISVPCPVCNTSVPKSCLNGHLDKCLLKDFTEDIEVIEVPAVSQDCKDPVSPDRQRQLKNRIVVPPSPPFSSRHASSSTNTSPPVNDLNKVSSDLSRFSKDVRQQNQENLDSVAIRSNSAPVEQIARETANNFDDEVEFISSERVSENNKLNSRLLIKLASNPRAVSDAECEEIIEALDSASTGHFPKRKRTSLSELLRPLIEGESPIEYAQLARQRIKSTNFSNSENEFTFQAFSTQLGCTPSTAFKTFIGKCNRDSDGSFIVPEDIVDLVSSPKVNAGQNHQTEILVGNNTARNSSSKTEKRHLNDANGPAIPASLERSKRPRSEEMSVYKPEDGFVQIETIENVQHEMNNCPICDQPVPRAQIEAHVNICLDNPDIRNEFCSSNTQRNRGSVSVGVNGNPSAEKSVSDIPHCPICDKGISRHQLEAHVDICMKSAGLNDAF